jgi:hypothetical protein
MVNGAFIILIIIGGILPITTYGQTLDHPRPLLLAPSANQGIFLNGNNNDNNTRCKCVVFGMDDIQDGWIDNAHMLQ